MAAHPSSESRGLTAARRRRGLVAVTAALLLTALTGCVQQPRQPAPQEYGYWLCRETQSSQRMDLAARAHNVGGISAAARDLAGAGSRALDALKRPGWPASVRREVTTLTRGQAAVIMTYRAIGSAQSMTEIRRVPPSPGESIAGFAEANRSLQTKLSLLDTCGP